MQAQLRYVMHGFEELSHEFDRAEDKRDGARVVRAPSIQPAFVEDTARQAATLLREKLRVTRFRIDVRNEESIHTHDAIAVITSGDSSTHSAS